MSEEKISYSKYKVKYVTKSGEVKYYEYQNKYVCKGKGLQIYKIIGEKYNDIIRNKTLKPIDKAVKIYGNLTDEEKKLTTVEKIRSYIYRDIYKNNLVL